MALPTRDSLKGGGSGKMTNTCKMLGQEYANEPYHQSAECRIESALEEVEKNPESADV